MKGRYQVEIARPRAAVRRGDKARPAFDQVLGHVRVGRAEVLQLHVGRVAHHGVEPAPGRDGRERRPPVEGIDALLGFLVIEAKLHASVEVVVDQGVAATDGVGERG